MTLWLGNLAAYSVQLAVLVAVGALLLALLRVHSPPTTLRFWQAVLVTAIGWPLWQLVADDYGTTWLPSRVLAGAVLPIRAEGIVDVRNGLLAIEPTVTTLVLGVLAAGVAARVGGIAVGLWVLHTMRTSSRPATSLMAVAEPLGLRLGVRADVRFSDAVTSPATIGALRPTVLLPTRFANLPPAMQREVLCHELIHVKRRDWLVTVGEELWCAFLWFHPAARVLASRLMLARETLVDHLTVKRTGDRRAYADALLEFSTAGSPLPGAMALIGRRHLEHRLALITREVPVNRMSLNLRVGVAALVVAAATAGATSVLPLSTTIAAQSQSVYRPGQEGVVLPEVVIDVKPTYTAEALQARIEGTVWLLAVVEASGDVGAVTVRQSLDTEHGLDNAAIEATRQWKFKPGTKDGTPVPVEVTIEMRFALK